MDRIAQLLQVGESQGVEGDNSAALLGGRLGGALARLGGGLQAPGQGLAGAPSDGFSQNTDPMSGAAAGAAMNPLLAGLASWNTDQKLQEGARDVMSLKGVEGAEGGGQQPRSGARDVGTAVQKLQQDYQRAKQTNASLTQQTETMVQKALEGEQQPQEQQQAGSDGGGAGQAGGAGGGGGCPNCQGGSSAGGPGSTGSSGSSGSSGDRPMDISQDTGTGNLTTTAANMLDSALQGNKDFDNMFSQFGQGTEGNCAAVACIKAAMDVYDNKVFDSVQKGDDGSYTIKMQDGQEVKVSAAELGQAARASNFDGPDSEAKSYAIMAYAAMAKRAQMEGHEGAQNYTQALNSLADGDNPYDSARFLGLKNMTQDVDPRQANGANAVVGWNSKHAVYIDATSNGTRTDHYGQARNYDGTDTRDRELTSGFTFKPRSSSPSSSSTSTSSSSSSVPGAGRSTSSSGSSSSSSSSSGSRSTSTPSRSTSTPSRSTSTPSRPSSSSSSRSTSSSSSTKKTS